MCEYLTDIHIWCIFELSNNKTKIKTMKKQATIADLRRILFDNDFYAVIGADEYTNEDARRILFDMPNQDAKINFIQDGDCLLCWF